MLWIAGISNLVSILMTSKQICNAGAAIKLTSTMGRIVDCALLFLQRASLTRRSPTHYFSWREAEPPHAGHAEAGHTRPQACLCLPLLARGPSPRGTPAVPRTVFALSPSECAPRYFHTHHKATTHQAGLGLHAEWGSSLPDTSMLPGLHHLVTG
jgi:hypothetical protein